VLNITFVLVASLLSVLSAYSQDCGAWANVAGWQGHYMLRVSGHIQNGDETIDVNSSQAADVSLKTLIPCFSVGDLTGPTATGAFHSHATFRCGTGMIEDMTYDGSGQADVATSSVGMQIDPSSRTYIFLP
jgi:hypothetical protein